MLQPENILVALDRDGCCLKLGDFGISGEFPPDDTGYCRAPAGLLNWYINHNCLKHGLLAITCHNCALI